MLNVCICDDDSQAVTIIQGLAGEFAREHPDFSLKTRAFSSGYDLLEHLDKSGRFDLYLLDILMPHLNGLELAEHIRARNEAVEIVFLTSSREYALDAFEVAACGYLLKPVNKEKFDKVLLTAAGRLAQPEKPHFVLKTKEGLRKVQFRDLIMVESFNHNRVCTLVDGSKLVTSETLGSILGRLSRDARFFSPHRAYIINLDYVAAINAGHVLLSTGQHIPVSRTNYPGLKQAYMDYLF